MQHQPIIPPGACQIELKPGIFAIVDAEDHRWLRLFKWKLHGTGNKWYAVGYVPVYGRDYPMHRIVLGHDGIVDHINGNGLDNRKENLRAATRSQNARNVCPAVLKGKPVRWDRESGAYAAYIAEGGEAVLLGYYETAMAATIAYNMEVRRTHGEFAWQASLPKAVTVNQCGRRPKPWRRSRRDGLPGPWYVQYKGIQHWLAPKDASEELAYLRMAELIAAYAS